MITKRERFSKQLCRVLVILETLDREGALTVNQIGENLDDALGLGFSSRTVRRDLDTLVECGFVSYVSSKNLTIAGTYKLTGESFMLKNRKASHAK